ncbi:MAG: MMPL family transporter [Planctomycetales bacterium]|nr:MMPL family transporter [Planctomycetales bacterium]
MDAERRRLRLLLVYAALALPAIGWGAHQALQGNHNSPLDWVPPTFPQRADYAEFCERFGPGDTVVVSWPGCTLDEPRLDRFTKVLRTAKVFFDESQTWLFHNVTSGREAVAALSAPADDAGAPSMSRELAVQRLAGNLVGPDGATTATVITFTAEGLKQRKRLVETIRAAAAYACGVNDADLHLAGPVIDGLSVDTASEETLSRFAAPSAAIVFLLCWASLRSFRAAAVVFGLAAFCQGATLALLHYSGDSMTALLIVLPPLVQVLAVAGGIHLANYFFDAQAADVSEPARQAFRMGWLPCVLSAGTTAIGMVSLTTSQLSPIRSFGGYAAAGVVFTTGALLSLLPAMFLFWPPRRRAAAATRKHAQQADAARSLWDPWAAWLGRRHATIALAGFALILAGGWFARQLSTSVRIDTFFAADHAVMQDYRWLEEQVGPMAPLEVVVACDSHCRLTTTERMELVWRLGQQLSKRPEVSRAFSAAECVPPLPELNELPKEQRAAALENGLRSALPQFEQLNLLSRNGSEELWRLTLRASALDDVNYDALLAAIRDDVDRELTADGATLPGVHARVTGVMPLVHAIQRQLLADLAVSFASALAMITLVMTLAQAGVAAGLLAMTANVFPLAVFFGWLGWRGDPVDIGTVMTASIALGIAVDDTLHFLTFFRRGLAEQGDRPAAVRYALRHCGPAMVQTSISCGIGMLAFAWSDFLPTSRFALSIATLLLLALAGDLVLLPALLLGPLGRVIDAAATDAAPTAQPRPAPSPALPTGGPLGDRPHAADTHRPRREASASC